MIQFWLSECWLVQPARGHSFCFPLVLTFAKLTKNAFETDCVCFYNTGDDFYHALVGQGKRLNELEHTLSRQSIHSPGWDLVSKHCLSNYKKWPSRQTWSCPALVLCHPATSVSPLDLSAHLKEPWTPTIERLSRNLALLFNSAFAHFWTIAVHICSGALDFSLHYQLQFLCLHQALISSVSELLRASTSVSPMPCPFFNHWWMMSSLRYSKCLGVCLLGWHTSFIEDRGSTCGMFVCQLLQWLLQRLLLVRAEMFTFHQPTMPFLGFIISPMLIEMDPKKESAVWKWLVPTDHKQLQRFLGFANFYRHFVQKFSLTISPLHALTSSKSKFKSKTMWPPEAEAAFQALLYKLSSSPILRMPNLKQQFFVEYIRRWLWFPQPMHWSAAVTLSGEKPHQLRVPEFRKLSMQPCFSISGDQEGLAFHAGSAGTERA